MAINAEWYGRLRWVAAGGQLVTIAFVLGPLGVAAPGPPLVALVGVTLLSNALFWWWTATRRTPPTRGQWHAVVGGLMVLDLAVLTAMLALTGGPTNPFIVFYFVNLALSGVVLPARWAWALSVLAILGFTLLSIAHQSVDVLRDPVRLQSLTTIWGRGERSVPLAIVGAGVAFAASAIVIVNFTTRLTSELRNSERARRRAEKEMARVEKLEALGTLAAGAAHELATPLSTIAVAVSEAHRELLQAGGDAAIVEDLALVRREVGRCRTILERMATESGQPAAGLPERLTADELVGDVLDDLPAPDRVDVEWLNGSANLELVAPSVALAQAIRAVVQNAIDATNEVDPAGRVVLCGDRLANTLRLSIADRGPGMPAEVLTRASEPFFTTKAPGSGMGLGLFLARSVVERLGGSLRLESPTEGGALVTIVLPLADSE
ncbi:Sensor histidine kinase RegB [Botrimarina colliarenosi]|uniref:histidine kinase n=1 Tax=Botrimarina colliarenosi TaxID=2528001 RepID=A0A5C6ALI0_9BACT|nr:Sensor histidine kinase RegB [Botrimarina colliarenosi]